jgi:hypothetical protein
VRPPKDQTGAKAGFADSPALAIRIPTPESARHIESARWYGTEALRPLVRHLLVRFEVFGPEPLPGFAEPAAGRSAWRKLDHGDGVLQRAELTWQISLRSIYITTWDMA